MDIRDIELDTVAKGTWNHGYGTQQRQAEIAALIAHLLPRKDEYRRFLEIGAAAGGTARLLNDYLAFDTIRIVDDNALELQNRRHRNIPQAIEWVGDSCSEQCREAVAAWGVEFDLIHIDAGHSYPCVKNDTLLALSVTAERATLMFHDVLCCEGITQWMDELRAGEIDGLTFDVTFGDDLGIGVFQWQRWKSH